MVYVEGLKTHIEELSNQNRELLSVILGNAPYNLGLEESRAAHLDWDQRVLLTEDGPKNISEEIELIPYKPIGKSTWKERSFQRTKSLTHPSPLESDDASSN